ncbi:RNA-binding domain-containing protein [Acaromyces ingoldii]|uniref:RNA-binding domain-containing protein n=1 Tax=Acaromyces ingoldii TaxID=215250 RepID=A0A316YG55_9BASI|nr:RNA-binding domain-containing protein [Acaromyces ingoldii]PWN87824.1 RNA-binding domain-containing protein [Acaromyces ingoldii]
MPPASRLVKTPAGTVAGLLRPVGERRPPVESLEEAFAKFGRVLRAQVMYDPHSREPRGFAFVTMADADAAEAAISGMTGVELMGRTLSVQKARRGRARTPTPGRYFGPPKGRDEAPGGGRYGPPPYDRYGPPPPRDPYDRYGPPRSPPPRDPYDRYGRPPPRDYPPRDYPPPGRGGYPPSRGYSPPPRGGSRYDDVPPPPRGRYDDVPPPPRGRYDDIPPPPRGRYDDVPPRRY